MTNLIKKRKRKKSSSRLTIRLTAPTMNNLYKVSKEQEKRVNDIYEIVKKEHNDISKSNWVVYSDMSADEIEDIKNTYPIGCCFDKSVGINKNWDIGDSRTICYVGSIVSTLEDEIVMFMKRGCLHYEVTKDIMKAAENYSIKSEDEDHIPSKENMDAYKKFVLEHRKTKR